MRAFLMRLGTLFRRNRRERELADEFESHLAFQIEDNVRCGMPLAEARRAAMLKFGGVEAAKEAYRERSGLALVESFTQDLAQGVRALRRNPWFAAISVLTLALGVGGCAAMYAFVRQTVLMDYPYPDIASLIVVEEVDPRDPDSTSGVSAEAFVELQRNGRFIRDIAGYNADGVVVSQIEGVRILEGVLTTPNVFSILGVQPLRGRVFDENDPNDVVVMSERVWRSSFRGSPEVLGSTIDLNRKPYTVIGVMPESFWRGRDLWMPLGRTPAEAGHLRTWARLSDPGAREQAQAELAVLSERIRSESPAPEEAWNLAFRDPFAISGVRLGRLLAAVVAPVVLVFLIACVNVAHLQLGRDAQRNREMATRLALGAGRGRLVRQLLAESLFLALLAGALGTLFASWGLKAIMAYLPTADSVTLKLDLGVLCFLFALSAASVLVIGLMPALRVSALPIAAALRNGSRGETVRSSFRSWLVTSELALSMVLLIGTGMMIVLVQHVTRIDLGFDQENLWTARLSLRGPLADPEARRTWAGATLDEVRTVPGVVAAAIITDPPLTEAPMTRVTVPGDTLAVGAVAYAGYRSVTPEYFETLGIPLRLGRGFNQQDRASSMPVVIVNETLARSLFQDDALGKRLRVDSEEIPGAAVREVIGVVADIRESLDGRPAPPLAYVPFDQDPVAPLSLVVRAAGTPDAVGRTILEQLRAPSPQLVVQSVFSFEQRIQEGMKAQRFLPASMTVFASFGLFLAAVGLYGTTSRAVAQRTREFGVRQALGALPRDILKLVIRETGRNAAIGMALGAVGSWAAVRLFLSALQPHERPASGVDLLATWDLALAALAGSAMLASAVLFATYIPAIRATKVDPITALRHE